MTRKQQPRTSAASAATPTQSFKRSRSSVHDDATQRKVVRVGICTMLCLAVFAVSGTTLVGNLAVDDAAIVLKLIGRSWRRALTTPLNSPIMTQKMLKQFNVFSNSSFVQHFGRIYIAAASGRVHTLQRFTTHMTDYWRAQVLCTEDFDPSTGNYSVSAITPQGTPYGPVNVSHVPTLNPVKRPWYLQAVAAPAETAVWTGPYSDLAGGRPVFTLSVAVRNYDGSLLGVMAMDIQLSAIHEAFGFALGQQYFPYNAYAVLLHETGLLASNQPQDAAAVRAAYSQQLGDATLLDISSPALSASSRAVGAAMATNFSVAGCSRSVLAMPGAFCYDTIWFPQAGSLFLLAKPLPTNSPSVQSWTVVAVIPVANPAYSVRYQLAVSAIACFVVICVTIYSMGAGRCVQRAVLRLGLCECKRSRPGSNSTDIELQDWRASSRTTPVQSTRNLPPVIPQPRKPPRFWSTDSAVVTVYSLLVLGSIFVAWSVAEDPFNELMGAKADITSDLIELSVKSILYRPQQVVTLMQDAIMDGSLPVDPALLNANHTLTLETERLLVDWLSCYAGSLVPVQGILTGYPSADSYGAALDDAGDGMHLRVRSAATNKLLEFYQVGQDGLRNESAPLGTPVIYDTLRRPWYHLAAQSTGTQSAFTPIYTFADVVGSSVVYGITLAKRFQSPTNSSQQMMVGIDMTLALITRLFQQVAPPASTGLMFLAESLPGFPLVASNFADVTGCFDAAVVRLQAGQVQQSTVALAFGELVAEANATLAHTAVGSQTVLSVGLGLDQLRARVIRLGAFGLDWTVVVAYFTSAFVKSQLPYENAVAVVTMTCVWLVVSAASRVAGRARQARELKEPAATVPAHEKFVDLIGGEVVQQRQIEAAYDQFAVFLDSTLEATATGMSVQNPLMKSPSQQHRHSFQDLSQWEPGSDPVWRAMCMMTWKPSAIDVAQDAAVVPQVIQQFVRFALQEHNCAKEIASILASSHSWVRLFMLQIVTHRGWRRILKCSVWLNMGLALWQADLDMPSTTQRVVLGVEALFVFLQFIDFCFVFDMVLSNNHIAHTETKKFSIGHVLFGLRTVRTRQLAAHAVLSLFMCGDVIWRLAVPYSFAIQGNHQLFLPVSAVLRPLMLIFYSSSLRSCFNHLIAAIAKSQTVFSFLLALLIAITMLTLALLPQSATDITKLGQGFADIRGAFVTMFTFVCTKSNYLDVVNFSMEQSTWLLVYFIVITFIGVMLLVSLLVASFQMAYSTSFESKQESVAALACARRRVGLFIAFRYLRFHAMAVANRVLATGSQNGLDAVVSAQLSQSITCATRMPKGAFNAFFAMQYVPMSLSTTEVQLQHSRYKAFADDFRRSFEALAATMQMDGCSEAFVQNMQAFTSRCKSLHHDSRQVPQVVLPDLRQFVQLCEQNTRQILSAGWVTTSASMPTNAWQRWLQRFFDDAAGVEYSSLFNVLLQFHTMVLALSVPFLEKNTSIPLYVLLLLHALEIIARVMAEGLKDFWYWPRLRRLQIVARVHAYRLMAVRCDIAIVAACAILWVVGQIFGSLVCLRVAVALPMLRFFTSSTSRRRMLFGTFDQLPQFLPLIALQIIVIYQYAVVGCWWFAGELATTNEALMYSNFDNFPNAIACLLQILSGDAWEEVMFLAFQARRSLIPAAYFLSYVMLFVVMFVNVVIAIIVEAYQALYSRSAAAQDPEFYRLLEARSLQLVRERVLKPFLRKRRGVA